MSRKHEHMSQDELKKIRRMSYIKMVAMVGFVVAVIAFGSIAWFTMNREVEGSGVQMKADDLPFEIATKGSQGIRYQNILKAVDSTLETGEQKTVGDPAVEYYQTSGKNDQIMLRYDTGNSEIGPGGSGAVSLYVVPKTAEELKLKVSFRVAAFAEIDTYETVQVPVMEEAGEGEEPQQATDPVSHELIYTSEEQITGTQKIEITQDFAAKANAVGNTDAAADAANYIAAANFLKGHIMFFGGTSTGDDSSLYYYTKPYTTGKITPDLTIPAGNKENYVQVPLYWMWTNTLGQIALKDNTSNLRRGLPVVKDMTTLQIGAMPNDPPTDKEKVIQYVKDNKDSILKNWRNIELSETEEMQIPALTVSTTPHITQEKAMELLVDGMIDDVSNENNFKRLSKCYNAADSDIGSRIAYFMIEVTVEPVESAIE